ncbi:MAG: nicotinamide mononucleotide transporter [Gallionella sp.]|nr:nicotinamide mononucleotide transporter [Gallionella sp.]
MFTPDTLQWLGCGTGALGSLLLALNTRHSGWGFVFFLISNGFWTAYGLAIHAPGLIVMQIIFTTTSLIGIYRWLLSSKKELVPAN